MATSTTTPGDVGDRIDIAIGGMTCASCAARVEKELAKVPGVDGCSVNFATEIATVQFHPDDVAPEQLATAVTGIGYTATLPQHSDSGMRMAHDHMDHDEDPFDIRLRLIVAIALGLPVVLMSMVPALMFDGWQWVAAALATPVIFWSGWPYHRATLMNL
ncbi:MAG: cation-translocating P-type ATPase, partial [Acidimicrobiia bacterium]|nr:cation-translocating P-type ATPase [Acidimicrobiia bacterium]